MAETKRFGMQWAPGKEGSIAWPEDLDPNAGGWASRAFNVRREAINIGKRYHEQNLALQTAAETKRPPPELPDVQARHELAREDYKRLRKLGEQMAAIDKEVATKESLLRPFDYNGDLVDAMKRQEMRAHLRANMNDDQRREAMRSYEWRRAALETQAELSGLSPVQHKSYADETLKLRYGTELAGIAAGKQALEAVSTSFETVRKAIEHELSATSGTVTGPPPKKSEDWV
jgi:hypothetical protein